MLGLTTRAACLYGDAEIAGLFFKTVRRIQAELLQRGSTTGPINMLWGIPNMFGSMFTGCACWTLPDEFGSLKEV